MTARNWYAGVSACASARPAASRWSTARWSTAGFPTGLPARGRTRAAGPGPPATRWGAAWLAASRPARRASLSTTVGTTPVGTTSPRAASPRATPGTAAHRPHHDRDNDDENDETYRATTVENGGTSSGAAIRAGPHPRRLERQEVPRVPGPLSRRVQWLSRRTRRSAYPAQPQHRKRGNGPAEGRPVGRTGRKSVPRQRCRSRRSCSARREAASPYRTKRRTSCLLPANFGNWGR
jgi:hypothetical protein